jgi:drug/metabolite transporter (DMT)-like permease
VKRVKTGEKMSENSPQRKGILTLVTAALSFSLMTLAAKALPDEIRAPQTVFVRSLFMVFVLGIWSRFAGYPLTGGKGRFLLLLRGLFGTMGFLTYFTALKLLPLADTVTIFQSHPLIVSLLSPWLLEERNRTVQWILIGVSFTGVAIVLRPTGTGNWTGKLIALSCAVFAGVAYIIIRKLRTLEQPLTIALSFPLVASVLIGPLLLTGWKDFSWVQPDRTGWLLLGAVALFSTFGQLCITTGLGMVPAARGTALSNIQVVYALLFGWIFFHEIPSITTVAGAAIIMTSLIVLSRTRE